MKRLFLYFILFALASLSIKADVKLPAIFSDNMLLQQSTDVNLWGWASSNDKVTIAPSWTSKIYTVKADQAGKWNIKISTSEASYNVYTIQVSDKKTKVVLKNVLIGEVWLCSGQSNMEMPMKGFKNQPVLGGNEAILKSKNKNIRFITVKRTSTTTLQDDIVGTWKEATPESVRDFSATAYYYGKLLNEMLDVPVGLVLSSWGGSCIEAWMSKDMLNPFNKVTIPAAGDSIKVPNRTPTTLFNAMINPIVGYTIKGCIWYQGESNYEDPDLYPSLFSTMVSEWRNLWKQGDFPFYFFQIAPYNYESIAPVGKHGGKFNSAFLREAQLKSVSLIPNSGMAVLMDIGEDLCIHPQNKRIGGERMAMLALGKTYGLKGFAYESPTYKEMEIKEGKAILSFENAPMWVSGFGHELKAFEIAGADKVFHPAKAELKRSKVEVSSNKVAEPVAVRYAFKDYVKGDLYSTEGLPLSSFRIDNWNE